MFKRTFKDFKNLKKWEHVLLCWERFNTFKNQNNINKLRLNYIGYYDVHSRFAYRNKFKYSIRKKSRMKKLNFEKLENYRQSLQMPPLTSENIKYRLNLSKKLFLLAGFMLFNFVALCYLFSMLVHIILAVIFAYLVYNYLYVRHLTFFITVYIFLFKNDKKMIECVDE